MMMSSSTYQAYHVVYQLLFLDTTYHLSIHPSQQWFLLLRQPVQWNSQSHEVDIEAARGEKSGSGPFRLHTRAPPDTNHIIIIEVCRCSTNEREM